MNGNADGRRPIGAGHGDAGLGSEQAPERYIKAADRPTVSEKRIESSPFFRRRCIPAVFPMIDEGAQPDNNAIKPLRDDRPTES